MAITSLLGVEVFLLLLFLLCFHQTWATGCGFVCVCFFGCSLECWCVCVECVFLA